MNVTEEVRELDITAVVWLDAENHGARVGAGVIDGHIAGQHEQTRLCVQKARVSLVLQASGLLTHQFWSLGFRPPYNFSHL